MFDIDFSKYYLKLNVEEINIKYSWYNVINDNSKFSVYDGTEETYKFFDSGNYNIDKVLFILNIALTNIYTITYDSIKNNFVFTALDPLYSFTSITIGWLLGLDNNTQYVGSFTSKYPVTMQYSDVLYLNSDIPRISDSLDNVNQNQFTQSTIICTIPILINPMDNIHYKPNLNTGDGIYLALRNFDSFNFWITSSKGNSFPVLNHDFTFTLKLEQYSYNKKLN
jgi:hypothetical protein